MTPVEQLAFEAKYIPEPNSGCWLWLGACSSDGYGCFTIGGRTKRAHRVSFEAHIGEIPLGHYVCHKCDLPLCVNPAHLFAGTQQDNIDDAVRKGRAPHQRHYQTLVANGRRQADRLRSIALSGEQNPHAKLTAQSAAIIRASIGPARLMAARFGISETRVCQIRRGEGWRDADEALAARRSGDPALMRKGSD